MEYQDQLELFAVVNAEELPKVEEVYAVFNDPEFLEPRFASGEIHPMLRERVLETAIDTFPIPGPAKRFMLYINESRAAEGKLGTEGPAILRVQRVTKEPWRTITGSELEGIDEGRRANG